MAVPSSTASRKTPHESTGHTVYHDQQSGNPTAAVHSTTNSESSSGSETSNSSIPDGRKKRKSRAKQPASSPVDPACGGERNGGGDPKLKLGFDLDTNVKQEGTTRGDATMQLLPGNAASGEGSDRSSRAPTLKIGLDLEYEMHTQGTTRGDITMQILPGRMASPGRTGEIFTDGAESGGYIAPALKLGVDLDNDVKQKGNVKGDVTMQILD